MMRKSAIFSTDRKYRYTLSRTWIESKPYCLFVCLNPSTADENFDDPTIRRCIGYAQSFGCGCMVMVNMYAFRSTDPSRLIDEYDPIGPENDQWIKRMSQAAHITIAAWGSHSMAKKRHDTVLGLLKNPMALKVTSAGYPGHPLYLKKTLKPFIYSRNRQEDPGGHPRQGKDDRAA